MGGYNYVGSTILATPRTIDTQVGRLEFAEFGTGPAVLALHGAMGGWDQSRILAQAALANHFRALAVSRPGYLGTPLSSGTTPEQQADLLAALLDKQGIERAGVVTISGGGYSALHFALRHAPRCAGLVLISTCGTANGARIPFAFHVMRTLAHLPWLARAFERKMATHGERSLARAIPDPSQRQQLVNDAETWPLYQELMRITSSHLDERLAGTNNDIRVTRVREYPLEQIRVPSLVIHGTHDRVAPYDPHAIALSKRIPGARLLSLDGGEHSALFTHRAQIRAAATQFLREVMG